MLKLMYITNHPEIARIAEKAGVNRIFVDMEYIGKSERQGGMDTVQSHHTIEDIKTIKTSITNAEVMVRINPIHEETKHYNSSEEEINAAIEAGADILMLPFFKTVEEVKSFIELVGGRVKTLPLVETPEAVDVIDNILELQGIDEIYVGLNDLSLGYGKKFMFELLADGTVEYLVEKFKSNNIKFGFGGLASLNGGLLPGHMVLKEHYRLGSSSVILSRSFCNVNQHTDLTEVDEIFRQGVTEIRQYESMLFDARDFDKNKRDVCQAIKRITEG